VFLTVIEVGSFAGAARALAGRHLSSATQSPI
jgi:hypothetical protein